MGFIGLADKGDHIHLTRFCLRPEYLGSGIGHATFDHFYKTSLAQEKPIRLEVLKSNPARRRYEEKGFILTSEHKYMACYERKLLL